MMDAKYWRHRVIDCRRRAELVYPVFVEAMKVARRFDRLYTYWSNRMIEAERKYYEEAGNVQFVPANKRAKDIERENAAMREKVKKMSKEDRMELLAMLQEGGGAE